MKEAWKKFEQQIDGLSSNERIVAFALVAITLVVLIYFAVINPLMAKQQQMAQSIKQQQTLAATMQGQIQKMAKAQTIDPDADDRARLEKVRVQVAQMRTTMLDTQKDLVPPDRMAAVLEEILKRNSNLRLKSLKTLPVTSLLEPLGPAKGARAPAPPPPKAAEPAKGAAEKGAAAPKVAEQKPAPPSVTSGAPSLPAESVFKHGVEIVVEGGYLDMLKYLSELEAMPSQLFWGKADLHVDEYPRATLTLTLFTLSLDKRWMGI